mgnify:CR=1 FL=1
MDKGVKITYTSKDVLVFNNNHNSILDYKELKSNIDILHNLICRNKTENILTSDEFIVIDKLYERLNMEYNRLMKEVEQ